MLNTCDNDGSIGCGCVVVFTLEIPDEPISQRRDLACFGSMKCLLVPYSKNSHKVTVHVSSSK